MVFYKADLSLFTLLLIIICVRLTLPSHGLMSNKKKCRGEIYEKFARTAVMFVCVKRIFQPFINSVETGV